MRQLTAQAVTAMAEKMYDRICSRSDAWGTSGSASSASASAVLVNAAKIFN